MISNRASDIRPHRLKIDPRAVTSGAPMDGHVACELFEYLEEGLAVTGCDHSFRCSEAYLSANDLAPLPVLQWLARHGARCDCEVLEEFEQYWPSLSLAAG